MKGKMNLYYDEEGDYLEFYLENTDSSYAEEIGDDITLFKSEKTNEIIGISILNFRKRSKKLNEIELNLPFNINFS